MNYTTRLEPIENPAGFYMKAAYFFCRRMLGKVIMPLKVIYARKPALLRVSLLYQKIEEHRISLPASLRLLVKSVISLKNSCTFCNDLALALAVRHRGPGRSGCGLGGRRLGLLEHQVQFLQVGQQHGPGPQGLLHGTGS